MHLPRDLQNPREGLLDHRCEAALLLFLHLPGDLLVLIFAIRGLDQVLLQSADALSALDIKLLQRELWSLGERLCELVWHLWHGSHAGHIRLQLAHEVLRRAVAELLLK